MNETNTNEIIAQCDDIVSNFSALRNQAEELDKAASLLVRTIQRGNKIIWCGNGGSAADSQHLATELLGRFLKDRAPLPSMALTTDTSCLTAIGNDLGFDQVFSRQLGGVGKQGDTLVCISTSGNSKNVLEACAQAAKMGIATLALTGQGGGELAKAAQMVIQVPATRTDRIQEMHIAIGHMLCGIVESACSQGQ